MSESQQSWPVDGHVHFHELDLVPPTLDAAADNFRALGVDTVRPLGALLLTQTAGERVFERLRELTQIRHWRISAVPGEPETLLARRGDSTVAIVCGRQVRAADGLEVLGLGTCNTFDDGRPFLESVQAVRQSGALTVVPWAVGKWLGRRGQRVRDTLASIAPQEVFVGDNGGRLNLLGKPPLVREFQRRGFRVLPGTDPFPFGADHRRVGRFGFLADLTPTEEAPWRNLRAWLLHPGSVPRPFGRALGPVAFLFNQLGIRIYNRLRREPSP